MASHRHKEFRSTLHVLSEKQTGISVFAYTILLLTCKVSCLSFSAYRFFLPFLVRKHGLGGTVSLLFFCRYACLSFLPPENDIKKKQNTNAFFFVLATGKLLNKKDVRDCDKTVNKKHEKTVFSTKFMYLHYALPEAGQVLRQLDGPVAQLLACIVLDTETYSDDMIKAPLDLACQKNRFETIRHTLEKVWHSRLRFVLRNLKPVL